MDDSQCKDACQNGTQPANKMLTGNSELNLLLKVQSATKDWDTAPEELVALRELLTLTGYEVSWSPKRLGINMLTPNKIRGMVLKRVLMKLYPFETFWVTANLDETLQKCWLVCQQLHIESDRSVIWGHCSMNPSFEFWKKVLNKVIQITKKARDNEQTVQEAKSLVVSALIASRGTDWDKRIAQNFEEWLGNNRFFAFVKSYKNVGLRGNSRNSRDTRFGNFSATTNGRNELPKTTTTAFASELKKEAHEMTRILESIEKHCIDASVLRIEVALIFGKRVAELASEFEGYMTANNRGAFKDVDSLANHTDKVIRAMSKLTAAYNELFQEFQKHVRSAGGGDELRTSVLEAAKLAGLPSEF